LRTNGVCDYCGRAPHEIPCKFPDRHLATGSLGSPEDGKPIERHEGTVSFQAKCPDCDEQADFVLTCTTLLRNESSGAGTTNFVLRHRVVGKSHTLKWECPHCGSTDRHRRHPASTVNDLMVRAHANSKAHGFWDGPQNTSEKLMLIVTELAEACEWLRMDTGDGPAPSNHIPEFSGFTEELADVVIRAMDLAGSRKADLGGAILAKMKYNESRPIKHGKGF